ncbi:Sorting nexin mvp1 [Pichia californica]|uniref:Sorting nexin mvp1 n=1 Tax=Pichia californica TaxID=460514 RepID=A0A9P6WGY2_9ASCO|nr:Sorting nexin mvp1 [[Candida] californica]
MFLSVPNDFSNWKKFANIELNDEFDGIRINLPRRFNVDLTDVLKGLRDNESEYEENYDESLDEHENIHNSNNRNEFVINNINQIWNESPTKFKDKEFISNINKLNDNLTNLAEFWSKLYLLVERIEKRELALSVDHQRFAIYLENLIKNDTDIFGMDNLIENKSRTIDDETQNMTIINSILSQVCKYFVKSRQLKEEELLIVNNEILESWKSFHDYLISLHFLIERFFNYKIDSEKEIQNLLQRIIKTNEKIKQLKMKSDIRGSEIDKHINILILSMDQLSMLISRIILVKTAFCNEFKLFQKVKYLISEVFQNWFDQRSKYSEIKNDNVQKLLNELKDMPLGD